MTRYLFIVARDRPDIRDYLARQLSWDEKAEIIPDRRFGERRRSVQTHLPERRRADPRRSSPTTGKFRSLGFMSVRQKQEPPVPLSMSIGRTAAERVTRAGAGTWTGEGRELLRRLHALLEEHGRLWARANTAEQECQRLQEEVRRLRRENEKFRTERAEVAETFTKLMTVVVPPIDELLRKLREVPKRSPFERPKAT